MINQKKANEAVWTDVYTYAQLPQELTKLDELAHNLWWVWTPKAKEMFESSRSRVMGKDRRKSSTTLASPLGGTNRCYHKQ